MRSFILLLGSLIPATGLAQPYSVNWHKIAGGGVSAGAAYQVSGTICQSDAGVAMSGGSYSLSGGFWSFIALEQTPGAPLLFIHRSGNAIVVSWPSSSAGFVLQQNSDINLPNWTTSGFPISDDGTNKSIIVTSSNGHLFFRLKRSS